MRSLLKFLALSCSLWAASLSPSDSWQPVGPFGGDALTLAADPGDFSRLFVGTTNSQIYSSIDGGAHWTHWSEITNRQDSRVVRIIVHPSEPRTIFAGAFNSQDGGGVYRSSDGGRTWADLPGISKQSVRALVMSPKDPGTLFAGTATGVFRTTDSGASWQRISPEDHEDLVNVVSLALDPDSPQVVYAGTTHLPWKTTDGGASWFSVKEGLIDDSDIFSIAVDWSSHETAYLAACSGIYRSDNSGLQWRKIQGIPTSARRTRAVTQDPSQPKVVYAGTTEGLWKTEDGGSNWKRTTSPTLIVNQVLVDPKESAHVLLATDRAGILESRDAGVTFQPVNAGFSHRQAWRLVGDSSQIAAAVLHDKEYGGVFVSQDGSHWNALSQGLDGNEVYSLARGLDGELLAGTNAGLYRYQATSDHWERTGKLLRVVTLKSGRDGVASAPLENAIADLTSFGPSLFAATPNGVLESRDKGATWMAVSPDWAADRIAVSNELLVAATPAGLQLSSDRGRTWKPSQFPETPAPVNALLLSDKTIYAATERGLFRSLDAGATWERHGRGVPFGPVSDVLLDSADAQRIYVISAQSDRIYVSRDGGSHYDLMDNAAGFAGRRLRRLVSGPAGRLYLASGYDGLFSRAP
jgi:photosystem II stability/assembly factor-like uncharacterized protein